MQASLSIQSSLPNSSPLSILDLCCGTGASSHHILKTLTTSSMPSPILTCIDFSEKMLTIAKQRLPPSTIFYSANASSLPCETASFDIVSMSFGYRNLVDKETALTEVVRVLKPNGRLFILELTQPSSWVVRHLHSSLLHYIIPLIGKLLTGQIEPYRYLATSIKNFSISSCIKEFERAKLVCLSMRQFSFGSCTLFEVAHA